MIGGIGRPTDRQRPKVDDVGDETPSSNDEIMCQMIPQHRSPFVRLLVRSPVCLSFGESVYSSVILCMSFWLCFSIGLSVHTVPLPVTLSECLSISLCVRV